MASQEVETLLITLDQAFDKKSWHGTNLRGSLRGLNCSEAGWRPAPERHNIWELTLHAAYWKYAVRRRLRGEPRGSFPLAGSNWFRRPEGGRRGRRERAGGEEELAWQRDVRLLVATHRSLREAVSDLPASALHLTPKGSKLSNLDLIAGVAAHDLYHAGQIQLLKRLGARPG